MSSSRKRLLIIMLILCLLLAAVGAFYCWNFFFGKEPELPTYRQEPTITTTPSQETVTTGTTAVPLPDNPVDFSTLQAQNSDIYGWLYVPGTNVDYPLVCAFVESDEFYLTHDINKNYDYYGRGCIYSEKKNSPYMTDRNTVIYGHNMLDGSMFRTLHDFEDPDFFAEHDTFYIYIPGHILTYKIVAAYEYDNRHLLNSFDYSDDEVWAEYVAFVNEPRSLNCNKRDDVTVTTDDRIVTLSTCVGTNKKMRYLVQGVLIDDELTK